MPSLYLPVRSPDASGLHVVVPMPDVVVQPRVLALDAFAVEQVVLRLLHHRLVQVVPLGDVPGRGDLRPRSIPTCPSRAPCPPRSCRASRARFPRSAFRGRGGGRYDEVDVVELQSRQRAVDRLHQVLAVERVLLVGAVVEPPVELGRHDVGRAAPAESASATSPMIVSRLALGVNLGVVEEIHAGIARGSHAFAREVARPSGCRR